MPVSYTHLDVYKRQMHYILPRLYHTLYLAIAEAREGSMPGAASHMKEALQLALPDRIYLPFARLASDLRPLSALIPQELAELRAVCSRREQGAACLLYTSPWEAIRKETAFTTSLSTFVKSWRVFPHMA